MLPTGSPESRKGRAKKQRENEAKTKAEASAQIKAIRDKCAAKRKTGGGQDNRGGQDNHPIYVLEKKSHQANLDRSEDYKKRAVTAKTASGSWNSPCP